MELIEDPHFFWLLLTILLGVLWMLHIWQVKKEHQEEIFRLKKDRDWAEKQMKKSDQLASFSLQEKIRLQDQNFKLNDSLNKLQIQLDDIQAKRRSRMDLKNEKAKQKGKTSRQVFSKQNR